MEKREQEQSAGAPERAAPEQERKTEKAWKRRWRAGAHRFKKNAGEMIRAYRQAGARLTEGSAIPGDAAALGVAALIPAVAFTAAMAAFPAGVYPGGFALICAVGGGVKRRFRGLGERAGALLDLGMTLEVFTAVLATCPFLGRHGFWYFLFYLGVMLARAGLSGGDLQNGTLSRVTLATVGGAGAGMLCAWMEGFGIMSVLGSVNLALITPTLTYLLCGFYTGCAVADPRGLSARQRVYLDATLGTLLFLCVFALRDVSILRVNLAYVAGTIVTLAAARRSGALYGGACGLICGMASDVPVLAPSLALSGFFAGLFFQWSGAAALSISFLAAGGWAAVSGQFYLFGQVTADHLTAMFLFLPLSRILPKAPEGEEIAEREAADRETVRRARKKLKGMSEAFSSLSEVFYTVSGTMKKPKLTETSRLIADCCRELCSKCAISALCWGDHQSETGSSTVRAAARLLGEGRVRAEDFSQPFTSRCPNIKDLVELVNRRFRALSGDAYQNNRTSLLAGEYSSVARLLNSCAGDMGRELEANPRLASRACKVLDKLGVRYRRAAVFGDREMRIDVYGVSLDRGKLDHDHLTAAFEKEFRCAFEAPAFLMLEENVILRLRRRRVICLECAKAGCTKRGEVMNGDSVALFEGERDRFYALICDGMGSGRDAAFTSRLASLFLEKLMLCATPKSVTLEMLNAFLMSKTDETFSTVDLLEVDLLDGTAGFIKAGAAPSYVLRGDRVHCIRSRTPPAGTLTKLCAEETTFTLQPGDLVVLTSDGAAPENEENALLPLILNMPRESAGAACDVLFSALRDQAHFRDDLSLCVVRILSPGEKDAG